LLGKVRGAGIIGGAVESGMATGVCGVDATAVGADAGAAGARRSKSVAEIAVGIVTCSGLTSFDVALTFCDTAESVGTTRSARR
jgi:hypothetical protein